MDVFEDVLRRPRAPGAFHFLLYASGKGPNNWEGERDVYKYRRQLNSKNSTTTTTISLSPSLEERLIEEENSKGNGWSPYATSGIWNWKVCLKLFALVYSLSVNILIFSLWSLGPSFEFYFLIEDFTHFNSIYLLAYPYWCSSFMRELPSSGSWHCLPFPLFNFWAIGNHSVQIKEQIFNTIYYLHKSLF